MNRNIREKTVKGLLPEERIMEGLRLITVIIEKGIMEKVMAVARSAGARGGTILNGHGTASQEDIMYCGVHLIPEKEILIIVSDDEHAEGIMKSISDMPELKIKGMGIMFSVPVNDFKFFGL